MNRKKIENFDKYDMLSIYDVWPELAFKAYNKFDTSLNFKKIDDVVFAGMGGSGAIGDIFASILSKSKIHCTVIKGYVLPKTVTKNSLVVVISVSGNTIETSTILEKAIERGCNIIAVSSGGKIRNICKKNKINFYKIKMVHSPRASFIIYLFSMLKILKNIFKFKDEDVNEAIKLLKIIRKNNNSKNLKNNHAIKISKEINGIPLIYYPFGLQSAATRFKNSLQENAKIHTISEDIIEACHNGIVAWEKSSLVKPILIQGTDDNEKTKERWKVIKYFFEQKKIDYISINSTQGNIISKLVNLIYFLDYISIYFAIENKIDPTPVNSIEYIKKKLN